MPHCWRVHALHPCHHVRALLCPISPLAASLMACGGDKGEVRKRPCGGAQARRPRPARSVGEAPSAPSAGRFRSAWMSATSSQPARESQRGSGGWRRGGEETREGGRAGGRRGGPRERQAAGVFAALGRASMHSSSEPRRQQAARELRRRPSQRQPRSLPPANFASSPPGGPGARPGGRTVRSRSTSLRRSPAPPRGAAGGSRGPPTPAPQHCAASAPAGAGAAAARPAAGCWGAAAAAQGDAQRRRQRSPAGPQRTRCARAAARPGEHGRRGVTPPCPLGIKDIQPAGVGRRGTARVAAAAARALVLGGGKGCLESIHIFRPFCWTFGPRWTLQEELSSPAGSDSALRLPRLLPGSRCLGGVFAFRARAEEAATRAHTFRGGRKAAAPAPSAVSMRRSR